MAVDQRKHPWVCAWIVKMGNVANCRRQRPAARQVILGSMFCQRNVVACSDEYLAGFRWQTRWRWLNNSAKNNTTTSRRHHSAPMGPSKGFCDTEIAATLSRVGQTGAFAVTRRKREQTVDITETHTLKSAIFVVASRLSTLTQENRVRRQFFNRTFTNFSLIVIYVVDSIDDGRTTHRETAPTYTGWSVHFHLADKLQLHSSARFLEFPVRNWNNAPKILVHI